MKKNHFWSMKKLFRSCIAPLSGRCDRWSPFHVIFSFRAPATQRERRDGHAVRLGNAWCPIAPGTHRLLLDCVKIEYLLVEVNHSEPLNIIHRSTGHRRSPVPCAASTH